MYSKMHTFLKVTFASVMLAALTLTLTLNYNVPALKLRADRLKNFAMGHFSELLLTSKSEKMLSLQDHLSDLKKSEQEQARRSKVISDACKKYRFKSNDTFYHHFQSNYNQKLDKHHFIVSKKSKVIYCWTHKVASLSWMALFTKIYPDRSFAEELIKSGKYYKQVLIIMP